MTKHVPRRPRNGVRRILPSPSIILSGAALFLALAGTALAANGFIHARDIAPGAVTSRAIRNGAVKPWDLSRPTRALLEGGQGVAGTKGDSGVGGAPGANGTNGPNGPNGANGIDGAPGITVPTGPTELTDPMGPMGPTARMARSRRSGRRKA